MSPVLQPGRRRSRLPWRRGARGRRAHRLPAPLLAGLLAPAVVAVALVQAGASDRSSPGTVPLASAPPLRALDERPAQPAPPANPLAVDLTRVDAFRLRFKRPPRAGLVFDLDTGDVLWRRNASRTLPVASLTKMMTALVVAERTSRRETVKITRAALRYRGSGVGRLPRGKRVKIDALLHGLMLPSGNDAAIALAVHVAGSERRFVGLMNERARELGLRCTRFASSHGLEDGNRSCVEDLATLARLNMRSSRIRSVVRKRYAAVRFPIRGGRLHLASTNPLLRGRYPGAIGLKTGFTNAAGRCLVGVAERGGRTLGVVLLDSPDPGRQARKLLTTGFRLG